MRVLIVENMRDTKLGQVGVALSEAGVDFEIIRPWSGEALPADPDAYRGLVVFGGEQSALDDHTHPYLPSLAKLMRDFDGSQKPVLGICLGSQLLARAHGGSNLLGSAPEFGWHNVTKTEAAATDPVLGKLPASFPIFEWHSDTFTLPEGAIHMASNGAVQNQCFRIGHASYGMQFHFEAHRGVVGEWNAEFPEVVERKQPGWLADYPETAARHGPEADAVGLAIARAWVALVGNVQSAEASEIVEATAATA